MLALKLSESAQRRCMMEMETSLKQMSLQQKPRAAMLAIDQMYQRDGARMLLKARRTASMRKDRMERVLMMPFCSSRAGTISKTCGKDSFYMQHIKGKNKVRHLVVYTCFPIRDAPRQDSSKQVCTQCRGMYRPTLESSLLTLILFETSSESAISSGFE